jgi:hypothetical protein
MALPDIFYNEILRMRDKRLAEEERVLTAKILVNKVLCGFINDWNSYSTANQYISNENAQCFEFIDRLEYHLDQFIAVANEICSINILPSTVPNKLVELAAKMRPLIAQSNIVSADVTDNIPTEFDALLTEITEMSKYLDEYCGTA